MSGDFRPLEVVLDYERDAVVFDGTDLPFALSSIDATAKLGKDGAVVELRLHVDAARSVAKPPAPKEPVDVPATPTPETAFESQLDKIRNAHR